MWGVAFHLKKMHSSRNFYPNFVDMNRMAS